MTKQEIKIESIRLALQIPDNHKEYSGMLNQNIVSRKTTKQILGDAKLIYEFISKDNGEKQALPMPK